MLLARGPTLHFLLIVVLVLIAVGGSYAATRVASLQVSDNGICRPQQAKTPIFCFAGELAMHSCKCVMRYQLQKLLKPRGRQTASVSRICRHVHRQRHRFAGAPGLDLRPNRDEGNVENTGEQVLLLFSSSYHQATLDVLARAPKVEVHIAC